MLHLYLSVLSILTEASLGNSYSMWLPCCMVISIGETQHIYVPFGVVLNGFSSLLQCGVELKPVKPNIVVSLGPSSFGEKKWKQLLTTMHRGVGAGQSSMRRSLIDIYNIAPDFKNKTRYTPCVSPGSQFSHIATNKGNINRQGSIYNVPNIKNITLDSKQRKDISDLCVKTLIPHGQLTGWSQA